MFILVHPINVAGADRLSSYYLANLVGNPLDTTIAAACLVFGGVLERYPSLKFCLAHGGGFVPYQAGRFVHGWQVRTEPKKNLRKPPAEAIKRFYFDTIVHSKDALEFLVGWAGIDRVLLGSDYPFDMGMPDGVLQVRGLSIEPAEQASILGERAHALLGESHRRCLEAGVRVSFFCKRRRARCRNQPARHGPQVRNAPATANTSSISPR